MSVLFDNVKVGDTVHYSTPQGQTGKGKVVIHKGTHLVLNAGGKHGRPQVVTDKNYIKHSREGKVVGALLSRLTSEAKLSPAEAKRKAIKRAARNYADARRTAAVNRQSPYKLGEPQMNAAKAFGWVKEDSKDAEGAAERVAKTKKHKKKLHEVSKELAKRYVIAAVKDINHSSREAEGARTAAYADYMNKKAVKRSNAIAKNTKALRAYKDHVFGKDIYKEETVNELSTGKLVKYVSRAIADRKKAGHEFQIASKDQYAATPSQDKAFARIDKRSKGITKALAKIASNLPAEPLKAHADSESSKHGGWSGMNEVSAPGKEAWIKANKQRFIARYGKEKGLRVLYAKAWKDSKNESVNEEIKRYTTHHDDYMVTSTTGPAGHTISVRQGDKLIAQRLGGKLITNSKSGKKDTKLQDVIKAHTDHPEVQKFLKTNEARENEWAANQALAGQTRKKATGHYLVRDGRTLSGPHKPEEAVKAYKGMSDSKGVKIVHVKETHMFDVTRELISEAKVKEAAKKAINLKKKAKGNKHVETEPKLDLPDRVNTTTLSADEGQDNAKV